MILHVDMDAFYASVEERERPELRGKPVVVGGSPRRRGVVAAANYVARRFGIHSAMPSATAVRLCRELIFLPSRMSLYAEESAKIRSVFHHYTPLVEPLALDEAFLDIGASEKLFGSVIEIAKAIKAEIRERQGLVASVGAAPNKFVAKIASDVDKPDGLVVVRPEAVLDFLQPLPVGYLWGVGRSTGALFDAMGIGTIGELRTTPAAELRRVFGNQAEHLLRLAAGVDDRAVVPERGAKSISHERTFVRDVTSVRVLRTHVHELSDQVGMRLRKAARTVRRVQIKVRFADFNTITRASTLPRPTDLTREIRSVADRLLMDNVEAAGLRRPGRAVRLIGVGVGDFADGAVEQADLFAEPSRERDAKVDRVMDKIRSRYGPGSLRRGHRTGGDSP